MVRTSRRDFLKSTALGIAATTLGASETRARPFSLGLASYTFKEFSLADTISMAKRVGLEKIALKSVHLPLESGQVDITAACEKIKSAGLDLYGCGVIYMTNEHEVEEAFNYARTAKIRIIIGVPDPDLLELVNRKVQEYDIKLAIHNHGPEDKLYPTPESAYERVESLDQRVGLCLDIGHAKRSGIDPAAAARRFAARLLEVHLKDVSAATKEGQTVEVGRGVINIPEFARAIIQTHYQGTLAFEHEKDPLDPLPGLAESVGYFRGVLAAI